MVDTDPFFSRGPTNHTLEKVEFEDQFSWETSQTNQKSMLQFLGDLVVSEHLPSTPNTPFFRGIMVACKRRVFPKIPTEKPGIWRLRGHEGSPCDVFQIPFWPTGFAPK